MATDTTHLIVGASPAGAKAAQTCQRKATTTRC
jgi:thioredoxin reductase